MSYTCNLTYADPNLTDYVLQTWGPPCLGHTTFLFTVVVYSVIFFIGFFGNTCTCIVIARNKPLHTPTNFYLFSLAVSDVLSLVLGLPQELYFSITVLYPFPFSSLACKFRTYASEMTTYASILTISAFAFERWFAIRHPLKLRALSNLSRCLKIVLFLWFVAFLGAAPILFYVNVFRMMLPTDYDDVYNISADNATVPYTEICALDPYDLHTQSVLFNMSFWLFFIGPMVVMTLLCTHICVLIRKSRDMERVSTIGIVPVPANKRRYIKISSEKHDLKEKSSKRTVTIVLVAVVLAFFICWLPFHVQRLMIVSVTDWNSSFVQNIFNMVYFISGYFYYANSAVNPILYNALNRRFRQAFLKTICHISTGSRLENTTHAGGYNSVIRTMSNFGAEKHYLTSKSRTSSACVKPDRQCSLDNFNESSANKHKLKISLRSQNSLSSSSDNETVSARGSSTPFSLLNHDAHRSSRSFLTIAACAGSLHKLSGFGLTSSASANLHGNLSANSPSINRSHSNLLTNKSADGVPTSAEFYNSQHYVGQRLSQTGNSSHSIYFPRKIKNSRTTREDEILSIFEC